MNLHALIASHFAAVIPAAITHTLLFVHKNTHAQISFRRAVKLMKATITQPL